MCIPSPGTRPFTKWPESWMTAAVSEAITMSASSGVSQCRQTGAVERGDHRCLDVEEIHEQLAGCSSARPPKPRAEVSGKLRASPSGR